MNIQREYWKFGSDLDKRGGYLQSLGFMMSYRSPDNTSNNLHSRGLTPCFNPRSGKQLHHPGHISLTSEKFDSIFPDQESITFIQLNPAPPPPSSPPLPICDNKPSTTTSASPLPSPLSLRMSPSGRPNAYSEYMLLKPCVFR